MTALGTGVSNITARASGCALGGGRVRAKVFPAEGRGGGGPKGDEKTSRNVAQ